MAQKEKCISASTACYVKIVQRESAYITQSSEQDNHFLRFKLFGVKQGKKKGTQIKNKITLTISGIINTSKAYPEYDF